MTNDRFANLVGLQDRLAIGECAFACSLQELFAHCLEPALTTDRNPVAPAVMALCTRGFDAIGKVQHGMACPVADHVEALFVQPAITVHGANRTETVAGKGKRNRVQ